MTFRYKNVAGRASLLSQPYVNILRRWNIWCNNIVGILCECEVIAKTGVCITHPPRVQPCKNIPKTCHILKLCCQSNSFCIICCGLKSEIVRRIEISINSLVTD